MKKHTTESYPPTGTAITDRPLEMFDAILAREPTSLAVNANSVDLANIEPWRRLVEAAGIKSMSVHF